MKKKSARTKDLSRYVETQDRFDGLHDFLDDMFPHGHEAFVPISIDEMQLHSDKNFDYAHGGHPLGNFMRVGKILALYPRLDLSDPKVVAMVYALKQLDAVLWGLSEGHEQKVEGLEPRLADVSIYAKIVRCMVREGVKSETPKPKI